jgi:hypothetical protein
VRDPVGALKVAGATEGGLAGERLGLSPVETRPLAELLRERRLSAFQFEATGLRPDRAYSFRFTDRATTNVGLQTRTLPWRLPAEGMTIAIGSCFFRGFDMSKRIEAVLQRPHAFLTLRPTRQPEARHSLGLE